MALNPPTDYDYNVFNGQVDNPSAAYGAIYPSSLTTANLSNYKTPYMINWNMDVQRQLPFKMILDVGYVGDESHHGDGSTQINQLPVGTLDLAKNKGVNTNSLRPYAGYGTITDICFCENSNYNGLQTSLNRRLATGLQFGSSFTWSKALDVVAAETVWNWPAPQNSYDARPDYGPADISRKFVFSVNIQYQLPFAKGSNNAFIRGIAGGWTISPVFFAQSGVPQSVSVSTDVAGIGTAGARASLVAGQSLYLSNKTPGEWFNTAAFLPTSQMPLGQFGNSGRDILTGPGYSELDVSLFKRFQIREKTDLEFRAESFNLPNHPSFTTLGTTVGTSTFGAVTAAANPRIDQFALKFHF